MAKTSAASRLIWSVLPDPLKPLSLHVLAATATTFTASVLVLQARFPGATSETLAPIHIAVAFVTSLCVAAACFSSIATAMRDWKTAGFIFAAIGLFELPDMLPEQFQIADIPVFAPDVLAVFSLGLAVMAFIRQRRQLLAALVPAGLFCGFFALSEQLPSVSLAGRVNPIVFDGGMQLAMLLSGEFFLLLLYMDAVRVTRVEPPQQVGALARYIHATHRVQVRAQHPPVKVVYYPLFKETAIFATINYLLTQAGRRVKRASGKGFFLQAWEMTQLWFAEGIDPPSYYQLELYLPHNRVRSADYLTRFETKNGVFSDLNKTRVNLTGGNEMGDKAFFAEFCSRHGLACPQTLATIGPGVSPSNDAVLQRDLFVKPHKGNGANNAMFFSYLGAGQYKDAHGQSTNFDDMVQTVLRDGSRFPMLVQPWLRNHPDIADLAKDSLLTFRVITCRNEEDQPEVVLAMLRLLSKLEPDWKQTPALPDLEYAAAIDLQTGVLGEFLGDGFTHVDCHHSFHPVTGVQIENRKIRHWPEVRELALRAHRLLEHRVAIGWDVALTPDGPVLLEGNHSFDVMFLQRVHMKPIGETRLGDLLIHHMRAMFLTD